MPPRPLGQLVSSRSSQSGGLSQYLGKAGLLGMTEFPTVRFYNRHYTVLSYNYTTSYGVYP